MNRARARFLSVDVLRGVDMLVIIGLDALVHAVARIRPTAATAAVAEQFSHAEWAGVNAYDLVFPLFIFLAGVSLAIVDARPSAAATPASRRLLAAARRMAVLVVLGIVYNFGWDWSWERFRLPSVLGLIGVSSFLAAATLVFFRSTGARVAVWIAIAASVAALQLHAPVPGHGAAMLTPEVSINGYLDRLLLPGRLHGGTYDPEGLLGMVSATAIALAGAGAGAAMVAGGRLGAPASLGLAGIGFAAAGIAASAGYPAIKPLWTISFNLIAIGASMVMLGAARLIFDRREVAGWRRAIGGFLAPIGANAILAYMLARFLVYPLYPPLRQLPPLLELAGLFALIALQWTLLRALFARGLLLRA